MTKTQGIELLEGNVDALHEPLPHAPPGLLTPAQLGVLCHALIEPTRYPTIVKTNKFAKDDVRQLMRQDLLQERWCPEVAVNHTLLIVDKAARPERCTRRLPVGLTVSIQID